MHVGVVQALLLSNVWEACLQTQVWKKNTSRPITTMTGGRRMIEAGGGNIIISSSLLLFLVEGIRVVLQEAGLFTPM